MIRGSPHQIKDYGGGGCHQASGRHQAEVDFSVDDEILGKR